MFSPFISIPLGVFVWLFTLTMVGELLRGRGPFGGLWGLLGGMWIGIPFAIAGWTLLFKDRGWLTSEQDFLGYQHTKFVAWLGVGFAVAGVILLLTGLLSRSRSE